MQQPKYFGVADLATRWQYTPQGVNKLARKADFPPPAITINAGRVRVWEAAAIEAFEQHHPEVTSPNDKKRKVVGYYLAVLKGQRAAQEATP